MPEVLMLTYSDWSNTSWRFSKCLKLLGIDVQFYKGSEHKFGYPEQGEVHKAIASKRKISNHPIMVKVPELKFLVDQTPIIHFTASTFVDTGANLKDKHVVIQHGGSTYRKQPKQVNKIFNSIADYTIIQCPDLLNLGAKNEHLIYYPVDTEFLRPNFERRDKNCLVIGHFPSRAKVKGTQTVMQVINKLKKDASISNKFNYVGSAGNVLWLKQIERVSKCDILIETLNLKLDNKAFGEWGNQAIEAASLGDIVMTNSLTTSLYKKEYGDCALNIVNNAVGLEKCLRRYINMSDEDLLLEKKLIRRWVVKNHSMKATAIRLWQKIYCNFFEGQRKLDIDQKVLGLKKELEEETN